MELIINILKYFKIRSFIEGIQNLITWFPVIWNDRQFDHWHFYKVLHKKITLMEKFFQSDKAWSVEASKEAKKMKICIKILDRLIKDNYEETVFGDLDKLLPELDWINTNLDEVSNINETSEETKTKHDELMKGFEKVDQLRKGDLKVLFGILRKNIERWWD